MTHSFTDIPLSDINEDKFKVSKYIEGLSKFIRECDTPMTIAIQGDWGSGKTSIMKLVQNDISSKNIESVWFNTWQYSQFGEQDNLALSLMHNIVKEMSPKLDSATSQKLKSMLGLAGTLVSQRLLETVMGGVATTTFLQKLFSDKDILAKDQELLANKAKLVSELRTQFQILVDEKFSSQPGRIVIFIDDLDRLPPKNAVELLETIKIFLDCKKCVFVLAIDYEVVSQGIKAKYGELLADEKAKCFFDKIIQVPFKMPVADYDIKAYINAGLEQSGMKANEKDLDIYINLIESSISSNPRAIKRLFNSIALMRCIADASIFADPHKSLLLFALQCMQNSFEKAYNRLVKAKAELDKDWFNSSVLSEDLSSDEIEEFSGFYDLFLDIVRNSKDQLEDDDIQSLKEVLNVASITSVGSNKGDIDPHKKKTDVFAKALGGNAKLLEWAKDNAQQRKIEWKCSPNMNINIMRLKMALKQMSREKKINFDDILKELNLNHKTEAIK